MEQETGVRPSALVSSFPQLLSITHCDHYKALNSRSWDCQTLPCQGAAGRGVDLVFSSCHIRRMTRLASCRLWARRAARLVLPSAALRSR